MTEEKDYFNIENSPEKYLFLKRFIKRCQEYAGTKSKIFKEMKFSEFPKSELDLYILEEYQKVEGLFKEKLGIDNLLSFDQEAVAIKFLKEKISKDDKTD